MNFGTWPKTQIERYYYHEGVIRAFWSDCSQRSGRCGYFMRNAQFYAPAIFLMDRLDTKGVGQEWCGQPASLLAGAVPITHDSPLPWERWPAHDFPYFYCKRCCSLNIFNVGVSMTKTEEKYVTLLSGERAAHSDWTFAVARKTKNEKNENHSIHRFHHFFEKVL